MTRFKEPKRFWSKVVVGEVDECWEWLAGKDSHGYGAFRIHHKLRGAHRVAWVLTYGPIPCGLLVCHHCDNPSCCNPYHLFLGTYTDNTVDALRKGLLPQAVLTENNILEIRKLYATGEWTQEELAAKFRIYPTAISKIVRRERWRHV